MYLPVQLAKLLLCYPFNIHSNCLGLSFEILTDQEPEDKQLFSNQILHFNKFSPHPEIPPLHPSIFSQDALSVRPNLVAMTMPPGEEEEDDDFKLKFSL